MLKVEHNYHTFLFWQLQAREMKDMSHSDRTEPRPRPSARKKDIMDPAVSSRSSLTRLQKRATVHKNTSSQ